MPDGSQPIDTPDALVKHRVGMCIAEAIAQAETLPDDTQARQALGETFCAALDTLCAGAPAVHTLDEDLGREAFWWAECATPREIEAYAAAALRRIERANFAPAARKRIFLSLWQSMSADDQLAFLSKVDPGGKFIGGKG
jgi:hypothetical protein